MRKLSNELTCLNSLHTNTRSNGHALALLQEPYQFKPFPYLTSIKAYISPRLRSLSLPVFLCVCMPCIQIRNHYLCEVHNLWILFFGFLEKQFYCCSCGIKRVFYIERSTFDRVTDVIKCLFIRSIDSINSRNKPKTATTKPVRSNDATLMLRNLSTKKNQQPIEKVENQNWEASLCVRMQCWVWCASVRILLKLIMMMKL